MDGDIEIGDIPNILKLLGEVYDDPRDALAEFITNSIDAKATKIMIEINKNKKNPYVLISDNGIGMTENDLERIAKNIGLSIKRGMNDTVGEKGIGILGYRNIGESLKIISKTRLSTPYSLTIESGHFRIEKDTLESVGTNVYIYKIDTKSRLISQGKLTEYFKEKFRQYLSKATIELTVSDGKRSVKVMPEIYKGEPFPTFEQKTDYGIVTFSLFILPPRWDRAAHISVYRKGVLVTDELDQMAEFDNPVWKKNRVQGELTADFCNITSGRSGFVRDIEFSEFVKAVKLIEPQLEKIILEEDQKSRSKETKEIYKRLSGVFNRVLDELTEFQKFPVRIQNANGEEEKVAPTGVNTPFHTGKQIGKKGDGRPIFNPGKELSRIKLGGGLNWYEIPFEDFSEMRSRLDLKTYRAILINTVHPDYKDVTHDPDNKLLYLLRLTAKELALLNYGEAKAEQLLEKVIGLEIKSEKIYADMYCRSPNGSSETP